MKHTNPHGCFNMQIKSKGITRSLSDFDQLPNSAFIRLPTMLGLYSLSAASIWRGVKNGTIPAPKKLSQRTTGWNVGEVRASLEKKLSK